MANTAKKTDDGTDTAPLNFKVPASFRRQYKLYAVTKGITMTELLQRWGRFRRWVNREKAM